MMLWGVSVGRKAKHFCHCCNGHRNDKLELAKSWIKSGEIKRLQLIVCPTDLSTIWATKWQSDTLTDPLFDWRTDRLMDWQTDGLTEWWTDRLMKWWTDRLRTDGLDDWLNEWLLTDWLTDWLSEWINEWMLTGWQSTDWLTTNWLNKRLTTDYLLLTDWQVTADYLEYSDYWQRTTE